MPTSDSLRMLIDRAVERIGSLATASPRVGIVLGSGLAPIADRVAGARVISYGEIPGFPEPTVEGNRGRAIVGLLGGVPVVIFQGRFHSYEGHPLSIVTLPVRVMAALGVRTLILTAAVGAIDARLRPGDLVCLSDHINMIGDNPLRGLGPDFGPRFVDLSQAYDPGLRARAARAAARLGFALREGVYAAVHGPSYETPAEIRMLRTLGADVVGMSTVPEAIVARQAGLDVLAIALVTNAAAGVTGKPVRHEEVVEAGSRASDRLGALIEAIIGERAQTHEAQ
jgi:purine-nucleoside phosphorylase